MTKQNQTSQNSSSSSKGFASMPHEKVEKIARKGGHASAEKAGHEGMAERGHKSTASHSSHSPKSKKKNEDEE